LQKRRLLDTIVEFSKRSRLADKAMRLIVTLAFGEKMRLANIIRVVSLLGAL
jgi:hypothetical protein